ncbi:MAG: sulfotransferase [Chthoniobacterales bacterium]
MSARQLQPVFIVGQYKCGTTWLLRILSAHPDVIGVGEFDVVSAACDLKSGTAVLAPQAERLRRFFDKSLWCNARTSGDWEYTDVVARFERGEPIPTRPWKRNEPRKFMHLSEQAARTLYERIAAAKSPENAMGAFVEAVCTDALGETHVVLKSADQISRLAVIELWRPDARKIVIVRDGRDAAISAAHFQAWMREAKPLRGSPAVADCWELLHTWADQADKAIAAAGRGQIYLLRYEDWSKDFVATIQPLFHWLGLPASRSLLDTIQAQTSFEALTGRARGTEAKGVMRKGAVGEWRDVLDAQEQERAWRMAGEQLRAFGYTRDGSLQPLPDLSKPEEQPYRLQRALELEREVAALKARVRELKTQLRGKKTRSHERWTRPIQSFLSAARTVSKHFARLLVSVVTVIIPTCSETLCDAGLLDTWGA